MLDMQPVHQGYFTAPDRMVISVNKESSNYFCGISSSRHMYCCTVTILASAGWSLVMFGISVIGFTQGNKPISYLGFIGICVGTVLCLITMLIHCMWRWRSCKKVLLKRVKAPGRDIHILRDPVLADWQQQRSNHKLINQPDPESRYHHPSPLETSLNNMSDLTELKIELSK